MPIWGNTVSGWKNITSPFVNVGGNWKTVIDGWNNVAGVWKRCFGVMLVVTNSGDQVSGTFVGHTSHALTTNSVTCSAVGGTGPYTYQWQYIEGDSVNCTSSTAATTTWNKTATPEAYFNAFWQCKVTDSLGNIGYSPAVQVILNFISDL